MTVKELIEELQHFNQNLTVTIFTQEEIYEPSPWVERYTFDTSYYTGNGFVTLPKDVDFVRL